MTSPIWAGTTFFSVLEFLYKAFGICFMDHGKLMRILSGKKHLCLGKLGSRHRLQVKHAKVMCVRSVAMEGSRLV